MQTDRHKHAYTNTNNICISEHWSEAKHGCDDPFSHINKHHLSWMSTGLMLRSFCCLKYQLFIKRERVFNRVPSLFIHREWQKNPKELDFFFLMLLIFYIKIFLPSGLVKLVYWCLFFVFLLLREKETPDWTGLMRGLQFTRWHIVCSCFLAVWPYWILRWDTSLGFQEKSVKFLGVSVLICHLLHWIGGTVLKTVRGKKM